MNKDIAEAIKIELMENEGSLVEIGQWYWVKRDLKEDDRYDREYYSTVKPHKGYPWLACVVKVGSNYAKVKSPGTGGSSTDERIHFDNFEDETIFEPNPKKFLNENKRIHKEKVNVHMLEIKRVTALLGVNPQNKIDTVSSSSETALAVQSSSKSAKEYKQQLILAKDETLPELFELIKKENEHVVKWMTAETMSLEATVDSLSDCLGLMKKRILNVTLYTGITEEVLHVKTGEPALYQDKIHLMQNRLYMDEECLFNYKSGGMELKNIEEFDTWLSKKSNFERYLPFPKCIVTFRVRRNSKEREMPYTISQAMINDDLRQMDKITFMYIRNGENLYRLNTDMSFGKKIFPDQADFDPTVPMMIDRWGDKLIPKSRYDVSKLEFEEKIRKSEIWKKENPYTEWVKISHADDLEGNHKWDYCHANPYSDEFFSGEQFEYEGYEFFDKSSVKYDDALETITDQVDEYNRIALIVQGLLDRSEILHPHPPMNAEKESDFQSMVKLIYDGSNVLYDGDKPDILAYINKCNMSADKDSLFIGQLDFYREKEAIKESNRMDNNWRVSSSDRRPERFLKYGDPGPTYISKCTHFTRTLKATFEWDRDRLHYDYYERNRPIHVKCVVPIDKLFNVSAYKKGDFKRFFKDPRTRQEYLEWAPLLLASEDYHNGILRDQYFNIVN